MYVLVYIPIMYVLLCDGDCECMYLLCCTRWQELDGITLISRDATRQENGILFCIVGHEGDQTLNLIDCECMFGPSPAVAMDPGC